MFTVEERDRIRNRLVQMSRTDPRLVAGALVGSTAGGGGDRWSDVDLTFGLADGAAIDDVLADWTVRLANEFHAVHVFDLPHLSTIYRVFVLPNNLQVDLSFTPGNKFLAKGLKYDLLFGNPLERGSDLQWSTCFTPMPALLGGGCGKLSIVSVQRETRLSRSHVFIAA